MICNCFWCLKLAWFLLSLSAIRTLAKLLLATTAEGELREKILTENDSVSSSRSSSTTGIDTQSCVSPSSKVKVDTNGNTSGGSDCSQAIQHSEKYTVWSWLVVILTLNWSNAISYADEGGLRNAALQNLNTYLHSFITLHCTVQLTFQTKLYYSYMVEYHKDNVKQIL